MHFKFGSLIIIGGGAHHSQSCGHARYDVVVWSSLQAREHGTIDPLLVVVHHLLPPDHALHTSPVKDDP